MKPFSNLSIIRLIGFLFVFALGMHCKKDNISTNPSQLPSPESTLKPGGENLVASGLSSQTRTATFLNNLNNFQAVFGNQNYPRANPKDVEADDNIYTRSSKLLSVKDSTASFTSNSISSLALQGFGFTIPDDATIVNIAVRVKRFKKGTPSVGDHILSVMQRYQCGDGPCRYGIFWTYRDTYPGKIYPGAETEYIFSQSGNGNNGGNNNGGGNVSSVFVEDASYLRLKNIELGYSFNTSKIGIKNLRLYVSGQNLITSTNYTGLDPESTSLIDKGTYPQSKAIV